MRIDRFEIDKLYDRFTFKCHLDPKVNILVGNNGSFKSTVLAILYSLLNSKTMRNAYKISFAQADLMYPTMSVAYRTLVGSFTEIQDKAKSNDTAAEMLGQIQKRVSSNDIPKNMTLNVEQYGYSFNGTGCSQAVFESLICDIDFISTFDNKEDKSSEKQSFLDLKLEKLQSEYSYYLSDLAKKMTDIISKEGSITKTKLEEINSKKDMMLNFVNESFSKTGKELVPDHGRLTFRFKDGNMISGEALSAGEIQLMIILLTVLLEREKDHIVFLDEPEISLHIDWQYRLIDMLTSLNPNAQFVLTTHSPAIFSDGWGDKIVYMEDITNIND